MIKSNNKITEKVMQVLENNGKSVLDILKEKDSVCIPTHTLDCILEDEEVTIEEIKDYLDAIRNLSRGNYDYKPKTRFVRILFADLERFIKSNNESYVAKASWNIDNGKKGGRPPKEISQGKKRLAELEELIPEQQHKLDFSDDSTEHLKIEKYIEELEREKSLLAVKLAAYYNRDLSNI